MKTSTYWVGVIPWTITLEGDTLRVQAPWSERTVRKGAVQAFGFARDQRPRGRNPVRLGEGFVELSDGANGLLLVYEDEDAKRRDLAFTFDPRDRAALEIVEAFVDGIEARFAGTGQTPALRMAMGLGGGDMLAALLFIVVIGAVVAALMALGVIH